MEGEALEPKLEQAQRALRVVLDEACGVDLNDVDTGEMIRIEESLAAASKAAKEVVSVRLKMRRQRVKMTAIQDSDLADVAPMIKRRLFDDFAGKRWEVFAVYPSKEHALPVDFRGGWLVFESANEIRRVAPIPDQWTELSIDDLRLMCHRAARSAQRSGAKTPPASNPPIQT